jgi:signal transduction histidine kinase
MRLPHIPTIFRIAALTMILVLCSNLALLGFIHLRTHDDRLSPLRRQVSADARALADVYESGGPGRLRAAINDMLSADSSELTIGLFDSGLRLRAGNLHADEGIGSIEAFHIEHVRLRGGRQGEAGLIAKRLKDGGWLISGRLFGEPLALQRTIERALAVSLLLSLLFGVICAVILAHFVRRRVAAIGRVADNFGHNDLALRAPVEGSGDVFDTLARRINAMLDRIVTLMNELKMLTDTLAHDLRSPIGRLRSRVEQALTVADADQRDAALAGVLAEADALTHILTTVLEIGRYEALASRDQFGWLDPGDLLDELADLYGPLIDEAGLALEVVRNGPVLPVFGHRQLLAQAISNLIENALNHGGSGGCVCLFAERRGESQCIGVADRGPGIALDQVAHALTRFGRLDASRSRPGAGLGLSLVQAIAHLHDGRLELDDNAPGLNVVLRLPIVTRAKSPEITLAV